MQFDELEILREQVKILQARIGEVETERAKYLAMLIAMTRPKSEENNKKKEEENNKQKETE